jgi:ATPase subunit of ABC transporter with duplicated ATPase domains
LGLPGHIASDVPISKLSGGHLVRLASARIIWNSPNLLVLDEITTLRDHYTVSAKKDALKGCAGAVLLVSHDRFSSEVWWKGKL